MIKEIKPGAEQLRIENAQRQRSDAMNRALQDAEGQYHAVKRSYQSFIAKTVYVTAVMLVVIVAEAAIIWTQTQKECAPVKTWGYQGKNQTTEPKRVTK